MDSSSTHPKTSDLVLIGGGHSHLSVIKHFGMNPLPGLRITVISKHTHTPYSGMMPGLIAGHYQHNDIHIDLRKLCESTGVRLFHSEVIDLDLDQQKIICNDRPPVHYDWLSLNIGSQPATRSIPGASSTGIAVKPIAAFVNHWQHSLAQIAKQREPRHIAIVGGGAASIEVALACHYQCQKKLSSSAHIPVFTLYCASEQLLPSHNRRVQNYMREQLEERGIGLKLNHRVTDASNLEGTHRLQFADGSTTLVDDVFWAIHAGSPTWPKETALDCDEHGFIRVNQSLQSLSHPNVFAAGDIAHFSPRPLVKSGVYAVRAGFFLSKNLRRAINGHALKTYRPQRQFLSLLMTGKQAAIASRGPFSISGKWVWRWKDAIDRRFMAQYQQATLKVAVSTETTTDSTKVNEAMRCGGCGAKVGNSILKRVIAQLSIIDNSDTPMGLNTPDDAALITPPAGKQWLQTVDYFRAFIDDPYLLGRIATNHCLSDIYAMGATPHSALAIATVPYGSETVVEETLLQLMRGAVDGLNEQGASLIGGHSSEGAELGFGLSVNGTIDHDKLLTKGNLTTGQVLILTKPLGTGTLLAANMHSQAEGQWIDQALEQMLISNKNASHIFNQFQATACTDITGFGLLGHLLEMLNAANISASINLETLPVLEGAVECASLGWLSSLHPDNLRAKQFLVSDNNHHKHPHYPLLFDPQTAGGLLAAIAVENADACLQALQKSDCPQAMIIGRVSETLAAVTVSLTAQ